MAHDVKSSKPPRTEKPGHRPPPTPIHLPPSGKAPSLRKRRTDPLESTVEAKAKAYGKKLGYLSYKFTSPSRRSVPDQIHVNEQGWWCMVEYKRLGEKPTDNQWDEINALRDQNVLVYVIDNVHTAQSLLESARYLWPGQIPNYQPPDP